MRGGGGLELGLVLMIGVFSVLCLSVGGGFWDIYLERGLLLSFLVINGFIAYLKKGLG